MHRLLLAGLVLVGCETPEPGPLPVPSVNVQTVVQPIENGVLFVRDRGCRDIPVDEVVLGETSGEGRLLILPVCPDTIADTKLVLSKVVDPAAEEGRLDLCFDGELRVPSGQLVMSTSGGEVVLSCAVSSPRIRLKIWGGGDPFDGGGEFAMPTTAWVRVIEPRPR